MTSIEAVATGWRSRVPTSSGTVATSRFTADASSLMRGSTGGRIPATPRLSCFAPTPGISIPAPYLPLGSVSDYVRSVRIWVRYPC
jgi:hypothetical protein